MKVIQIVTQMEAAGAQRVAYLLHERFAQEGHSAELVFLYTKRAAYDGLPRVKSLLAHPPSAMDYIRIAYKLAVLLRTERPDVLITHTHYSNILGQSIGMLCGVAKRIAVNHSPECVYSPLVRAADRIAGASGIYKDIVLVSKFVSNSATRYPSAYQRRIKIINNGVSITSDSTDRNQIKARLGIPPAAHFLATVGRLSEVKNHSLLLKVLTYLPDAHLVIVGDGELRNTLLSFAESLQVMNRLHLVGELSPSKTHAIVASSDIFLFPSVAESMGLAVAEAMLLRKPIVASNIPVLADLLSGGGILAPAEDPAVWAGSIQRILSDPDLAKSLGGSAFRIACRYTPEKMADQYLSLMAA